MWLFSVIVVVLSVLVYLGYLIWDARQSVSELPKEHALQCDIHGLIPASATVTLMEEELEIHMSDGTSKFEKPRMCPMCFKEKLETAKRMMK